MHKSCLCRLHISFAYLWGSSVIKKQDDDGLRASWQCDWLTGSQTTELAQGWSLERLLVARHVPLYLRLNLNTNMQLHQTSQARNKSTGCMVGHDRRSGLIQQHSGQSEKKHQTEVSFSIWGVICKLVSLVNRKTKTRGRRRRIQLQ